MTLVASMPEGSNPKEKSKSLIMTYCHEGCDWFDGVLSEDVRGLD
jgi:hypothetical protein